MVTSNQGLIYIFTGDGKGKTSAALGVGLRASLNGMTVAMIQWYKDPSWKISEFAVTTKIPNFSMYPMGKGFYLKNAKTAPLSTGQIVVDKSSSTNHHQAATAALGLAQQQISKVDLLILDEINNALADRLINLSDVLDLINMRKHTHLILTGRNAPSELIDQADLVTSMNKIKHPYDQGIPAVRGLDF